MLTGEAAKRRRDDLAMRRKFSIKTAHLSLWILFLFSVVLFARNLFWGSETFPLLKFHIAGLGVNLDLRVDSLSTLLFAMISLLGASIGRFAIRFLDGEKGQWLFYRYLLLVVVAISLFVMAGNLLMLLAMWMLSSYGLHRLLVLYPDRPAARYAARKKIAISRAGDLALFTAVVILYQVFGTFDFEKIFERAGAEGGNLSGDLRLSVAAFLIVAGALIKSAQFPFHFWLPDTMETPAPVSALMHAGIINAGGFLIIRLSPVLQHAYPAKLQLVLIGAFTAAYGVLAMITQNDIKRKLAFSTISQMGMMMFACGLGAYTIALFHIFAHSFYKAHAFLSTGTLVTESRKAGFKWSPPSVWRLLVLTVAGYALVVVGLEYEDGRHFAAVTYLAVLVLGLFQNHNRDTGKVPYSRLLVTVLAFSGLSLAATAWAGIEYAMSFFLWDTVPVAWPPGGWDSPQGLVSLAGYSIILGGLWLSGALARSRGRWVGPVFAWFWNGGYLSYRVTRLIRERAPLMDKEGKN